MTEWILTASMYLPNTCMTMYRLNIANANIKRHSHVSQKHVTTSRYKNSDIALLRNIRNRLEELIKRKKPTILSSPVRVFIRSPCAYILPDLLAPSQVP